MNSAINDKDIGFTWWLVWSWLCIVFGTTALVLMHTGPLGGWAIFLAGVNLMIGLFMLHYSRNAFLWMTILSINPLIWIINGIYLKNRWNHPRVLPRLIAEKNIESPPKKNEGSLPDVNQRAELNENSKNQNKDYEVAAEELDSGNVDKGLWSRLFSEADGDENRTRARYIKERVTTMRAQKLTGSN